MTESIGGPDPAPGGDHVARNAAVWNERAADFVAPGEANWAADEPVWGIFGIPESAAHLLPDDLAGRDAIELGCGTAYVSAWLARRGARPVGVDVSAEQLATARRLQQRHGLSFPLHEVSAEHLPFADESFDHAISEYGACLWADPRLWVPEAARVLRPGGRLTFLTNGTILMLCMPDDVDAKTTERLVRPYFGMHRFEWPDSPEVEFHLGYGDWIRLLRASGFEVEDLVELRPGPDAKAVFEGICDLEWARRWPCEEVWKTHKRA